MTNPPKLRAAAVLLGAAVFIPWYSSQAIVDRDVYLGNPLPLVDWVVLGAAALVLMRPALAPAAAAIGLASVTLASLLMWGDSAEGLRVAIEPGLALAFTGCMGLLLFRPQVEQCEAIHRLGEEPELHL